MAKKLNTDAICSFLKARNQAHRIVGDDQIGVDYEGKLLYVMFTEPDENDTLAMVTIVMPNICTLKNQKGRAKALDVANLVGQGAKCAKIDVQEESVSACLEMFCDRYETFAATFDEACKWTSISGHKFIEFMNE